MIRYIVTFNDPAGYSYTEYVWADSEEEAKQKAKAMWGSKIQNIKVRKLD